MDKKITIKEQQAILILLQKYNVGIQEFIAIKEIFEKAPEVKETKVDNEKVVSKNGSK